MIPMRHPSISESSPAPSSTHTNKPELQLKLESKSTDSTTTGLTTTAQINHGSPAPQRRRSCISQATIVADEDKSLEKPSPYSSPCATVVESRANPMIRDCVPGQVTTSPHQEQLHPISMEAKPKIRTDSTIRSRRPAQSNQPTFKHTVPQPDHTATLKRRQKKAFAQLIRYLHTPLSPLVSVTTGLPHPQFPKSILAYHLLTHEQLDSLVQWYHQTHDAGAERWMYPKPILVSWTASPKSRVNLATKRRRFGRFIGLHVCLSNCQQHTKIILVNDHPILSEPPNQIDPQSHVHTRASLTPGLHLPPHTQPDPHRDQTNKVHSTPDLDSNADQTHITVTDDEIPTRDRNNCDSADDATQTTLTERLDREWQAAIKRAEEEKKVQEKVWRGRW